MEIIAENQQASTINVNSNFDFEPGNVVIFEDNFKRDNPGDFSSKVGHKRKWRNSDRKRRKVVQACQ